MRKCNWIIRLAAVITAASVAAGAAGCSGGAAAEDIKGQGQSETGQTEKETLKLALVGPMTGDNSQYGQQFERAVTEAVEAYNAKGQIQVTVDIFDDKNDAKESVSIANKILAAEDYAAIIGPFSSTCALAMAEVTDEEKMLTVAPTCSHADYVSLYDYTYRLAHTNTYEGEVAAQYEKDTWNCTKVAGIYSNNDWGIAIAEAYKAKAESLGMEVAANEAFVQGQTKDFSATLTKIRESGAEAIFYMGQYAEAGTILKQMKDMGMDDIKMLLSTGTKIETAELAGDAAKDAVFLQTFYVDPSNEKVVRTADMFKEKYGCPVDHFVMRTYDGVNWFLEAYDKCQSTDPDKLAEAMNEIGKAGFDGMGGYFKMGDDRNLQREFYYCRWNGKSGNEIGFELIK